MRDSMVTTVTTAGGGNYSEGDGDEGDYSQGNIAQTTGLSGHSTNFIVGAILGRASFKGLYSSMV